MKVDELDLTDLKGVGEQTKKKLNNSGVHNVDQLITHSPPQLADKIGCDLESAKQLFRKAREAIFGNKNTFEPATKAKEQRENLEYISTGTEALDKLFGNGVETQASTEVYGEFGSGKTQFCHTMAVRVQLPKEKGGLDGKCLWVDTENTFRHERIIDIANSLEMDPDQALNNILRAEAINSSEQYIIMEDAERIIRSENIKLIIIDSATGLFRSDYIGRGRLSDRQGQINDFVKLANNIARQFNVAVIMTNQVMQDPSQMFGDPIKPIGGPVFGHAATYRVYFKKSGKKRIAKMVDSPGHDEIEVMFSLTKNGVVDPEK